MSYIPLITGPLVVVTFDSANSFAFDSNFEWVHNRFSFIIITAAHFHFVIWARIGEGVIMEKLQKLAAVIASILVPEKREDFKQKQVESNSSFGESSGYSSFSEFKSLPRSESERSKTQDCHNSPSFFLPWEPCNKIVRRRRLSLVRERRPRLCKIDLNVCAESEPKSSRPKILDETGRKNLLHSDTRIQILSDHENETSLESNSRMSRNSKVGPGPDGCQGSDARPTSQTSRDLNDLTGYQSQVTRDQEIDEGISEVPLSNDSRVPNDDEVFVFDSARTDILPRRTLELPSEGYGDYEQRKGSVLTHEECDLYWRRHIEVTVVVDNDPNNLEMRVSPV